MHSQLNHIVAQSHQYDLQRPSRHQDAFESQAGPGRRPVARLRAVAARRRFRLSAVAPAIAGR